ncbi:MAG: pyrimidine dimer DNA glycosylase/endonuclease V [Propioniciclava sp.]
MMRLWSLDPAHLDRAALVACWREALLAQAVLSGRTKGYTRHPQLERFRALDDPRSGIATFLVGLAEEAAARGYRFDRMRIDGTPDAAVRIRVTDGQLAFEGEHLRRKVAARAPGWLPCLDTVWRAHPMMEVVGGAVAPWERASPPQGSGT